MTDPVSIDFNRLELFSRDGWVWQLHENQSYLGRVIFRLERTEENSVAYCNEDEWLALHSTIRRFEKCWNTLFQPDRYNYGQLGNIYRQLHVHAVPRYAEPRTWSGKTFQDMRWGRNWSPSPPSPLSQEDTYSFAASLRARLL